MKLKPLISVPTMAVLFVLSIGVFLFVFIRPQNDSHSKVPPIKTMGYSSAMVASDTNSSASKYGIMADPNLGKFADKRRIITDTNTGEFADISDNATTVFLKDKNDRIIWSLNLAKEFEDSVVFGERKIQALKFVENGKVMNLSVMNQLTLYFGKHLVGIDSKTGRFIYYGAD